MSLIPDCFDYIIGLSRIACSDCFTIPADADLSQSGLYMDEVFPLNSMDALTNCNYGEEVFTLMDRARDEGIRLFRTDANAMLMQKNRLKRQPFRGGIGRAISDTDVNLNSTYAGIQLIADSIQSGILIVKGIGTLFSTTGNVTVTIYDNLNQNWGSFLLNTVADTHTENTIVETELPLYNQYLDRVEYFFLYTVGDAPRNNMIQETCNINKTSFGWLDYLRAGGITIDDISNFGDINESLNDNVYGLTLDVELRCKVDDIWCNQELDFEGNNLAMAIAEAVRFSSVNFFLQLLPLSSNLNRDTLINGQARKEAREDYQEQYNSLLEFITDNVDVSASTDCFECQDFIEPKLGTIFS